MAIAATSDVQIDNDEVRVTEWRLAPGSATGHHRHEMDYVIVPVTNSDMTIVAPDELRTKFLAIATELTQIAQQ